MRPVLLLACILCFLARSAAQSPELTEKIATYYKVRQLIKDGEYTAVIELSGKQKHPETLHFYGIYKDIAKAYFEVGDHEKAMQYLRLAVENQEIFEPGHISRIYGKYGIEGIHGYDTLISSFHSLHAKYMFSTGTEVYRRVLELFHRDKVLREAEFAVMKDSISRRQVLAAMRVTDSINLVAFTTLLHDIGSFPGVSDIGKVLLRDIYYTVAHLGGSMPQDTLYEFLRTATLKGELPNTYAPGILDRVRYYGNADSFLYAEYNSHSDRKNGVLHYRPVADVQHLDARRAEFLLPPLHKAVRDKKVVLPPGYSVDSQLPLGL